jgi:hypothetical protein
MKTFDPGTFFCLPPGVKPDAAADERAEVKREAVRFNKAADHLRRRIQESGGTDRDAEFLLGELLYGNIETWKTK